MDTAEGRGVAADRFQSWLAGIPEDVRDAAGYGRDFGLGSLAEWANDRMKEFSELVGFWISWHVAGGFEELESAGWHRATIYRKIRRFRAVFDAHPDEYEFPWIKLDLDRKWSTDLRSRLDDEPELT